MNWNPRPPTPALATALALFGVLPSATARAQQATTIQACYEKSNGQLRIAAPADCRPSELAISWNIQPTIPPGQFLSTVQHDPTLIAGGAPGMKVSWQVTGVRSDPALAAHPFRVEQDKPANERGVRTERQQ